MAVRERESDRRENGSVAHKEEAREGQDENG